MNYKGLIFALSAIQQLNKLHDFTGATGLRVALTGGGCSGMRYQFSLVRRLRQDDMVFCVASTALVLDYITFMYLQGSIIKSSVSQHNMTDFGFVIYNPNASTVCSCGQSFQIK